METPVRKRSPTINSMNNMSLEMTRHLPAQSTSPSPAAAVDHTAVDRSLTLAHNSGSCSDIEASITEMEIRQAGRAGGGRILEPGQGRGSPRDLEQGQGLEEIRQPTDVSLELRASEDEGEMFLDVNNTDIDLRQRSSYLNGMCLVCDIAPHSKPSNPTMSLI